MDRKKKRKKYQQTTAAYLALGLLVLAGPVAEAGQYGGDGLGVVEAARKYDLIAIVFLPLPLLPKKKN